MKEQLHLLWRLQGVEAALEEAEEERRRYPQYRRDLERQIEEQEERLRRAQEEIEELERRRRSLEREVEENRERIKRSKIRLLEVKTNKEYEAVLHEIEWAEQTSSQMEEEILTILEELDTKQEGLRSLQQEVKRQRERFQGLIEELEERHKRLEEQVLAWQREKEELCRKVTPELFSMYNKLKEKRGMAIALVKDEACQGCYVHIPPQLYNEVLKNERLFTCPNCQRILYWKGEDG